MIRRVLSLLIVIAVTAALFYASRFWPFRFWGREGLFGAEWLRPQGDKVDQWLRGTDFAPLELLIWAVGAFVVLTVLQKVFDLFEPKDR